MPGEELGRVGLGSGQLLLEQLVEIADHGSIRCQVLRAHLPDGIGHARRVAIKDRTPEALDHRLEPGACRLVEEVVLLEGANPVAEVVRQRVEAGQPPGDRVPQQVVQLRRRRGLSLVAAGRGRQPLVEPIPLGLDDLGELGPDVGQDVAQPIAIEELVAPGSEALPERSQSCEIGPVRVGRSPAALQQPAEGLAQVTVRHEVVGQLGDDLVG